MPGTTPTTCARSEERLAGIAALTGMALVILTRLVRPLPASSGPVLALVIGSLPSLGAGVGLPFVARATQLSAGHRFRRARRLPFLAICAVVLAVLAAWEYLSLVLWALPVDRYDLVASVLGVVTAALLHLPFASNKREA